MTSGFIRPSAVGPNEENDTRLPSIVVAPTARTLSPSAGAVTYCQSSFPELPALLTTKNPFLAARSAAIVIGVVLPSISSIVWF